MAHNYLMLPENIQRRPLPGHRHRPKKDKNVSEAFTPVSRAGRRVPGEAKVKTAKEMSGADLFRFIKKLNNMLAGRPTLPNGEPTKAKATPVTVTNDDRGASGQHLQLPQKRPMADSAKSSTVEVINVRRVKPSRSNVIASSTRMELEDLPRLPSPVNDTINPVCAAELVHTYGNAQQRFAGEHFHHELLANTNPIQSHALSTEHAFHDINPPVFPDHVVSHQPANQLNFIFPVHEAPNHHAQPFRLYTSPTPGFPLYNGFETRNNEDFQLERVAVACAYAGMGEPMDIDPEFPPFTPNDAYADLNLERVALACAYAGMDEFMDTTLDDTQGPMLHFVPQEPHVFEPPGLAQYVPPQQTRFELDATFQPHMYQTVEPLEHQIFVDQDQRLRPPTPMYPIDHQFHQGHLVMNQIFPVHPHLQANQNPVMEGYFPLAHPRFDIGHAIHQYPDVHIPLQPIIHEPIDRQFMFYPPAHEELINQLHVPPFVNEMVGHDERIAYQAMGEAGELQLDNYGFFVNAEEPDHGELFEELFGTGVEDDDGDDEDDDDDEQVEIFI